MGASRVSENQSEGDVICAMHLRPGIRVFSWDPWLSRSFFSEKLTLLRFAFVGGAVRC